MEKLPKTYLPEVIERILNSLSKSIQSRQKVKRISSVSSDARPQLEIDEAGYALDDNQNAEWVFRAQDGRIYRLTAIPATSTSTLGSGGGGTNDHGGLTGLSDDDHSQYALLAGRSGGQILRGGTAATDDLVLRTTAGVGASGADMIFQVGNNGATEAARILNSGNIGINQASPAKKFEVLDASASQLRLTHTSASKFCDFTVDTNHDITIKPSSTGQIILQPTTDSTDFFEIRDADGGTPIVSVDATNERVGIGLSSPSAPLHVGAVASGTDFSMVRIQAATGSTTGNVHGLRINTQTVAGTYNYNIFAGNEFTEFDTVNGSAFDYDQYSRNTFVDMKTAPAVGVGVLGAGNYVGLYGVAEHASRAVWGFGSDAYVIPVGITIASVVGGWGAASNLGTGTVTDCVSLQCFAPYYNYGTIVNSIGLEVQNIGSPTSGGGGSITNVYGIKITTLSGTAATTFSIHTGTTKSYFGGNVGIGAATSPSTLLHPMLNNATTAAVDNVVTIGHNSSGTPAAGFGAGLIFTLESNTTADQSASRLTTEWVVATHASRTARCKWTVFDTSEREAIRIEASGSAPMIGVFGVAAVVRATALTTQLTTITHSGPGTPDYAIATPTNSSAWGFTTQDEFETVMSVIRNLQIRLGEAETKLIAYGWFQ